MFSSIFRDLKEMLLHGSMLTRLIIINLIAFVVVGVFLRYLFPPVYEATIPYLALSSDIIWNLKHPWVFITHMFMHDGFMHILWNMLLYYWFGTIIGDLIGDRKILPLFIYGGLLGAVVFIVSSYINLPENFIGASAVGASAAVMATIVAAGVLAPDYKVRLILIGNVSIKYIVVVLLVIDLIGASGNVNTGGHFAHLGGALFGWFYVSNLRRGVDLSVGFNKVWDKIVDLFDGKKSRKSKLKVSHKQRSAYKKVSDKKDKDEQLQKKVDEILDKINEKGYDQLTDEEKEFLFLASKKQK